MSKPIIEVRNISKSYTIGEQVSFNSLREEIMQTITAPFRRKTDKSSDDNIIWALKDVSFEVQEGEVLGIIGRNGAGKSTLLKILSRITEPTSGKITMRGRVASLLEVGTGFHPELTGRENILLNGALLGMSRQEIKSKFDEIVAFAEIEKFIDTPVKRYSSGMYVRLAFAVAAHLEPEILVVDEVLAVGDAQFQKKCLGKMGDVAKRGRTVLFVSHNMEAVSALCTKGVMLHNGTMAFHGEIAETITSYNNLILNHKVSVDNCFSRGGSGGITITDVWVGNSSRERRDELKSNEPATFNLVATVDSEYQHSKNIGIGFAIDSLNGRRLFTSVSTWKKATIPVKGNILNANCLLSFVPLIPGKYLVSASILHQLDTLDCAVHCASFEIIQEEGSFHITRTKDQGELNIPCQFGVFDV